MREEGELQAPEQLFDYVSEIEYSRIVQKRQADDFILDDGEFPLSLALTGLPSPHPHQMAATVNMVVRYLMRRQTPSQGASRGARGANSSLRGRGNEMSPSQGASRPW